MSIPHSMRAVVLDAPGPPETLRAREVPVSVFHLEEIAEAHRLMEDGHAGGKLVVLP